MNFMLNLIFLSLIFTFFACVFEMCEKIAERVRRSAVVNAVAQHSFIGEDDVMLEYDVEEFQSSFSGYTLPYLSRPLIFTSCF